MATALITGITGQDGGYLARRLLSLGYQVVGTTHRPEAAGAIAVDGHQVPVVALDLGDTRPVEEVVARHRPDELYNLGCRASSAQLFDDPLATAEINGVAVARLLEAICRHSPSTRFCQASSSEIFAGAATSPQDETTPKAPLNAYGAAKAFADHLVAVYRSGRGLFACSAILYPHESPRRPTHFLVRKITRAAAAIAAGLEETVVVGDLDAVRDWGYAPDVVEAMHRMLRAAEPRDYVLGTGEAHTVREVCERAFAHVGLDWQKHVVVDRALIRPPEPVRRVGNPARARAELDWRPSRSFAEMIELLVDSARAELGAG